jgi:hypothetical protein
LRSLLFEPWEGDLPHFLPFVSLHISLQIIASKQTKDTERTNEKAMQLLDYFATHPDAKVLFCMSGMVLNIHSDMAYLLEPQSHSRACGHFFLGWLPVEGEPMRLNGAFHMLCSILDFIKASATKVKLRALF